MSLETWQWKHFGGRTAGISPKSGMSKKFENKRVGGHSLRAQRLKKIKILKFSSEIENFKRATHQTPFFCGEF